MIAQIIILLALLALLKKTDNAALCAGIYAVAVFILNVAISGNVQGALIAGAIGGILGFIYFWLLRKTEGTFIWWIVLFAGLLVGMA